MVASPPVGGSQDSAYRPPSKQQPVLADAGKGCRDHQVDKRKLLARILSGSRNIRFSERVLLVEAFGFRLVRVSGSHHIFSHAGVPELVNLQDVGGEVKPYQMR
jgi:hypothetical protein